MREGRREAGQHYHRGEGHPIAQGGEAGTITTGGGGRRGSTLHHIYKWHVCPGSHKKNPEEEEEHDEQEEEERRQKEAGKEGRRTGRKSRRRRGEKELEELGRGWEGLGGAVRSWE